MSDPTAKRYAQEHQAFLPDNNPRLFAAVEQSGYLDSYLFSIGQTASERLEHAMSRHIADPEVQRRPFQERARELRARQAALEARKPRSLTENPELAALRGAVLIPRTGTTGVGTSAAR